MSVLKTVLLSHAKTPHLIFRNIAWRLPKTVSDKRIVFVVGAPRSGTTLLQTVLAAHSKLFSIERETSIFSARNYFSRNHLTLSQADNKALFKNSCDIIDFFTKGVSKLEEQMGGGVFVEKTPQHVKHISFLIKHFPNARFIHIVRDGRDCYCSSLVHPYIPQRSSVERFAAYWKKCLFTVKNLMSHPQVFTLTYENFTGNPNKYLEKLMQFLDLEAESTQLNSSVTSRDNRSQSQQFKRLKEPISNNTAGRWKKELSAEEVLKFENIAGEELAHYGYPVGEIRE